MADREITRQLRIQNSLLAEIAGQLYQNSGAEDQFVERYVDGWKRSIGSIDNDHDNEVVDDSSFGYVLNNYPEPNEAGEITVSVVFSKNALRNRNWRPLQGLQALAGASSLVTSCEVNGSHVVMRTQPK